MRIKQEVLKLKNTDIYSLLLFVLFKIKDIPEYSTLSELAFILEKDDLLKLCEYFGGIKIQIPTIAELKSIVYSLTLYQYIKIDGMDFDEALKLIGRPANVDLSTVKNDYFKMEKILDAYSFNQ